MPIEMGDTSTWPASAVAFARRRERATLGNAPLVTLLREHLQSGARLTFAEFMRLALYHPEHGYYAAAGPQVGPEGDFLTAPETHPAFGALVCRRLHRAWEALGAPERFDLVEAGAGTGALAAQILGYAGARFPEFARTIRYTLVETSRSMRARQEARLAHLDARVRWLESLETLAPGSVRGCIFSNELLDALPVHRVQMTAQGLREVYVGLCGETFVDRLDESSTPALAAYFAAVGVAPPEGCQAEVGLDALAWYRQAASRLGRGFLLTLDYGAAAADLYCRARPRGTLLCYFRHTVNEEPYRRIGTQDMTAHVDFTALRQAGEEAGLDTREECSQEQWLRDLGIGDWAASRERWPEGQPLSREALAALVDPEALGRLRVLVQCRE